MRSLIIGLMALAIGAQAQTATITRTFAGPISATVAGLPQSAKAEVQMTGTAEQWAQPVGSTFTLRGRLLDAPVEALSTWGKNIRAAVSGEPFRASCKWSDGDGVVMVTRATDWTWTTIEAQGTVIGLPVTVPTTRLTLVATVTNVVKPPVESDIPTNTLDAVLVDPWQGLGTHAKVDPRKAKITRTLHSAEAAGNVCLLDFEALNWPKESNGKKTVDGRVYIAWREGDGFTGGHFDWHGVGQERKTMGNIYEGYLQGKQPPHGAPVWFCILSLSGGERTNWVRSRKDWP